MHKVRVGKRLKKLRQKQGLSLIELAKASGVQIATLSRIEHDKMTGTVEAHAKIAYILNVSLAKFYQGIEINSNPLKSLLKSPQEVEIPNVVIQGDASSKLLTTNTSSKKMFPTLLTIAAEGKSTIEKSESITEQFVYVLMGSVGVTVGTKTFRLNEGNTFYFNANEPHFFRNLRKAKAQLICVRTQ